MKIKKSKEGVSAMKKYKTYVIHFVFKKREDLVYILRCIEDHVDEEVAVDSTFLNDDDFIGIEYKEFFKPKKDLGHFLCGDWSPKDHLIKVREHLKNHPEEWPRKLRAFYKEALE